MDRHKDIMPDFVKSKLRRRLTCVIAVISLFRLMSCRQLIYTYTYKDAGLYLTLEQISYDYTYGKRLHNYRLYLSDSTENYGNNYLEFSTPYYGDSGLGINFEYGNPYRLNIQDFHRHITLINCPDFDITLSYHISGDREVDSVLYFTQRPSQFYTLYDSWSDSTVLDRPHINYKLGISLDRIEVYGSNQLYCGDATIVDARFVAWPNDVNDSSSGLLEHIRHQRLFVLPDSLIITKGHR